VSRTRPAGGARTTATTKASTAAAGSVPPEYAECCNPAVPKTIQGAPGLRRSGTVPRIGSRQRQASVRTAAAARLPALELRLGTVPRISISPPSSDDRAPRRRRDLPGGDPGEDAAPNQARALRLD
jgi:hypothetical protein